MATVKELLLKLCRLHVLGAGVMLFCLFYFAPDFGASPHAEGVLPVAVKSACAELPGEDGADKNFIFLHFFKGLPLRNIPTGRRLVPECPAKEFTDSVKASSLRNISSVFRCGRENAALPITRYLCRSLPVRAGPLF